MHTEAGKFCPACKRYNELGVNLCVHCGTPLEEKSAGVATTSQMGNDTAKLMTDVLKHLAPNRANLPEKGISFFFVDEPNPFETRTESEFLIGRKTDDSPESMMDLVNYDAFGHGVSRRHAKIRHSENGYEIMDLESTNGTWLNEQRLVPNRYYPMNGTSLLRFGRMRMYAIYRESEN